MAQLMIRGRGKKGVEIGEWELRLFVAIHSHEGFLTFPQIVALLNPGPQYAYRKLLKLCKYGWLNRSDAVLRAAYGTMCYWLTEPSAALVAQHLDRPFDKHFRWVKKPHINQIPHDAAINDIRIKVALDCEGSGFLAVSEWVSEKEFREHPDRVSHTNLDGKAIKQLVVPDGFAILHNRMTGNNSRCLWELLHKVDNRRTILDEKVLPGIAYLGSDAYKIRSGGYASGRWFYVIHSPNADLRLKNLKESIDREAGKHADRFLLTTFETAMQAASILLDPIWQRGGSDRLWSLIDPNKAMPSNTNN